MSQQHGFYAHPQQPQNVYQQMGIPQPQAHLNYGAPLQYPPPRPVLPQPVKYSASNPPTSSFPNQPPKPPPVQQPQQSLLRPLPAPTTLLPSQKLPTLPLAPSASRPLPTPGKPTATDPPINPSTQLTSSSSPPKRRQSPPKFTSDPSSRSNSPTKPSFPSNRETPTPNKPAPTSAGITTSLASSSPPKPLTTVPPSSSLISKPASTDGQLPTKPTPVWKRTIPEIPAPVWGYAAGLVPDPHPKLSNQPPHLHGKTSVGSGIPVPESLTKSTGAPNKLKKKNKTKEKDATRDEGKKVINNNYKTKDQINAVYGNAYGLGYSSRQAQEQRHSAYHVAHQGPYSSSRTSPMNSRALAYRPEEDHDEDDEDEETEDAQTVATEEEVTEEGEAETEEEEEEETGEEEDASDSVPTLRRFGHGNGHRRYYSQPVANVGVVHRREEGYHGSAYDYEEEEEEEDTPKKRNFVPEKKVLLRPKVKVDPYGGYEDVSPIGHGGRKPVRPRSEIGDVGGRRMFGAVDTTPRNARMFRRSEDEATKTNHRRPRSAIEEREMLILNVRARNRMKNREVESDYGAEETRLAYDDDDDGDYEEEEDAMVNDRRRRWRGEELNYRPQSQPNPSPRLMNGGRAATAAGLPRPPPMIRDQDSAGFISHSQAEKKIRGGPRSAFVQVVSEEELEGHHEEERAVGSWPGDLPRLPRTPGGGGVGRGYFGPVRRNDPDLNLDEPPPPASIVRTPSPGVTGGYILQERQVESQNRSRSTGFEQAHRRFEVLGEVQQPPQGQGRVYSRLGHPPQPVSQPQVPQQRRQQMYPPQQGRYTTTPSPRKQQQTPAPPRPVGIESPYPVGGRDRMADMTKLERIEDENGQMQARRISGVRNVSKVVVMGDDDNMVPQRRVIPTMSVSDESDHRPLPSPSLARTHAGSRPQSMVITGFGGSPKKQALPTQPPVREDARDPPRSRTADLNSSANPNNNDIPAIQVFDVPGVYISKPGFDDDPNGGMTINISGPGEDQTQTQQRKQPQPPSHPNTPHSQYTPTPAGPHGGNNGRGLLCGGCHGPITHGRILSAMGLRWHPPCFKCSVCDTLLEHVSSYENDGKAYCHLDYHEAFAPRCYSCKTSIIDEQFISLDDPALGKRTYHKQHFFCAECGDPFLDPSIPLPTDANGELVLSGDGEFEGFIVYRGHPYCEACHVRLRLPKCKRCKKAIRDDEKAVEALGGKWCWACFVCAGCSNPFEDPSFFQRGNQPYCESCFSIMLRNEV